MGKKLLVALALEGKFAGEGLQSMDEDDDMQTAMARELVERNGIGETADAVWRELNLEHQRLVPTKPDNCGEESEPGFISEDLLSRKPGRTRHRLRSLTMRWGHAASWSSDNDLNSAGRYGVAPSLRLRSKRPCSSETRSIHDSLCSWTQHSGCLGGG